MGGVMSGGTTMNLPAGDQVMNELRKISGSIDAGFAAMKERMNRLDGRMAKLEQQHGNFPPAEISGSGVTSPITVKSPPPQPLEPREVTAKAPSPLPPPLPQTVLSTDSVESCSKSPPETREGSKISVVPPAPPSEEDQDVLEAATMMGLVPSEDQEGDKKDEEQVIADPANADH
jgi:hypothetical protein